MRRVVSWLTELSYRRAGLVLAAVVAVLGMGAVSMTRINQELIPDIEFPIVTVIATSPGAQPSEVVSDALGPIESVTEGLDGLKSTQTTAVNSLGVVLLQFDFGVSLEDTEAAVRQALNEARLDPSVQTQILLFDPSILPIVDFTLQGSMSQAELLAVAQERLVPALSAVDGVADVEVLGGALQQVLITVDRAALLRQGLTYDRVADILSDNNVILPSGETLNDGQLLPLETVAVYRSLDDIRELPIRTATGFIKLRDLATVEQIEAPATGLNRNDGERAVSVRITKTKEANTVETTHRVEDVIAEIEPTLPEGLTVTVAAGQSEIIEESVSGVITEGVIGGVLAIIIVFIFLANWRTTLITAVSIPLSIIAAVIALEQSGYTLNLMTLGGLTIAIGRVIDDSIVVLENVYRHMTSGERGFTAIVNGAREVTIAIVGATATTTAVFLPLGLVGGLIGQLFLPFALAVVFALLASLLVAVTVIPVLARLALAGKVKIEAEKDATDTRLARAYAPFLRWSLANRWKTLGVAAVLFVASLAVVPQLPVIFLPESGEKIITVNVDARPGESIASVEARAIAIENILGPLNPVRVQTAITGASGDFSAIANVITGRDSNSATILVELPGDGPSKIDAAEQVRALIEERLPDEDSASVSASGGFGPPSGIAITLAAETEAGAANLEKAADLVAAAVASVDGTANVSSDVATSRTALEVVINTRAAAAAGLTPSSISTALRNLSASRAVTTVNLGEDQLPVQMVVTGGTTDSVAGLAALEIASGVRLGSVAEIREVSKQTSITRVDGRAAAAVSGDITDENTGGVTTDVQAAVDKLTMPEGVEVIIGGVASDIDEGFAGLLRAIGISILLVYVIMVFLFGSWLDPFVILFSLPLAVIGALIALFVTGSALSISALIGILMLVGIVVTNAIVMLEFVIMLRHERGYSTYDALMVGAQTRLRPILMTALAAMLALIPLSLGLTEGALIASDLGRVVIGGLFSSTLLTLFVVPVIYSLVDGMKARFQRRPAIAADGQ